MSSVAPQKQALDRAGRVAAIYARVSSERQRQDQTIASQTVGLRELAAERGLLVSEDLVFEDEGFSGRAAAPGAGAAARSRGGGSVRDSALPLARSARAPLRLPGAAARGVPARGRGGVLREGARAGGTPEDELLRQFQGMIAEYERAQIRERSRRGKAHRDAAGRRR